MPDSRQSGDKSAGLHSLFHVIGNTEAVEEEDRLVREPTLLHLGSRSLRRNLNDIVGRIAGYHIFELRLNRENTLHVDVRKADLNEPVATRGVAEEKLALPNRLIRVRGAGHQADNFSCGAIDEMKVAAGLQFDGVTTGWQRLVIGHEVKWNVHARILSRCWFRDDRDSGEGSGKNGD